MSDGAKLGAFLGTAMAMFTANEAQKAWQSGRCVKLEPTTDPATRDGLDPLQKVAITAAPRSKIDGGPVGGRRPHGCIRRRAERHTGAR